MTQYCTFTADGLDFGIEVADVQEVMRAQVMTHVPRAHPAVQGLLNLRGEIVTAIDLRHRLGLTPWASTHTTAVQPADVVGTDAAGATDVTKGSVASTASVALSQERMNVVVRSRGEVASLLVDDIGEVLDTSDTPVAQTPSTIPATVREVLVGVIPLNDRLLLVLDAARAADVSPLQPSA